MTTLVWFRDKDLRLRDHQPLATALASRGDMACVYVLEPARATHKAAQHSPFRTRYWLEAATELRDSLEALGSRLIVLEGPALQVLPEFVARHGVKRLLTQRAGFPSARRLMAKLEAKLSIPVEQLDGETLFAPETLRTTSGEPYRVFTPFSRAARRELALTRPLNKPHAVPPPPKGMARDAVALPTLEELGLNTTVSRLKGGESAALKRLRTFVSERLEHYDQARDSLTADATSRLSQDLHFGTLSPRQVYYAIERTVARANAFERFTAQLLWREFAYATLWDFPHVLQRPFNAKFDGFPWRDDAAGWDAWAKGQTGYPVVDAAARQLLSEGFVHNRARMIAASFLTKDLLIDFRQGEAHYLRWLVDGDEALNDMGWQWSSGTGCDPQPYFRVFNPVTQGERFDAEGGYVKRYVPELERVPVRWVHAPWEAPAQVLREAGVVMERDYPAPVVEHAGARKRFLAVAESFLGKGEF